MKTVYCRKSFLKAAMTIFFIMQLAIETICFCIKGVNTSGFFNFIHRSKAQKITQTNIEEYRVAAHYFFIFK